MPLAGQNLSNKAIDQMKKSKFITQSSKYDWKIAEDYWDIVIDNGSVKRKNTFFTLRDFKYFCDRGFGLKELKLKGYSKHLLQFFSNFLKNKITLSKEVLEKEYLSGKSIQEIGLNHNITRDDMTFLRQIYQIDRKGPKYIHRKKTETFLTKRQKEILYGSMMGDAKKNSSSSAGFGHGTNQKEYLLWKYNEFENIASKNSLKSKHYISIIGSKLVDNRFYTKANSDIEIINEQFYFSGKKEITKKILENLTPLSIAVWYMDDGSTGFSFKSRQKFGYNIKPEYTFCTDSFSDESCLNIQKWFLEKWDISTKLRQRNKNKIKIGNRIVVNNYSVYRFVELINPYILSMFKYKINYDHYIEYREIKNKKQGKLL